MTPFKLRVTHVITDLSTGGAQMMLYRLLRAMDHSAFESMVISLTEVGPIGERIQALGIPVRALGMRRGVPSLGGVWQLVQWLRQDAPHLVQTWMYHADLMGGLAARWAGAVPTIWGIHNSNLDTNICKRSTRITVRLCANLSPFLAERIVCCSEISRRLHASSGYASDRMLLIPNGFDLTEFRPDQAARLSVREELGLTPNTLLIGLFGRFDPQKDHHNFIMAAEWFSKRVPDGHYLLCGDGVTWDNPVLADWINGRGLCERFHLLGVRQDMARLTAALDIASTASAYGEAFPLVVGEAMSCGVPCVVTEVGDSAFLVGDGGRVVPIRNPQALARAWLDLVHMEQSGRQCLGQRARCRIEAHFSLPVVVDRYQRLYKELARSCAVLPVF